MGYDKTQVRDSMTPEDIYNILCYFDADPQEVGDHIVARTICHDGDSKKLYYYFSNHMFYCYTQCGSFDVFELVQKVTHISDLNEAISWVVDFCNLQSELDEMPYDNDSEDWKVFKRYESQRGKRQIADDKIMLPEYDISIIKNYPKARPRPWMDEGISKDVIDYQRIVFDPVGWNVLIPHFDIDDRCVGIRQRTMVKDNERFGKYRPWYIHGKLYNHPLAFNLYGSAETFDRIHDIGTAIIVEGEKSVLKSMTYFGTQNNICVATCGHSLSNYQFKLLKDIGCEEIVIAFDHDFSEKGSQEYKDTKSKIAKTALKFSPYANISVMFDEGDLLGYKDSPLDKGSDVFMYLFKHRYPL